ncbi:Multi antimicrobial extrusion protein [Parasponia andersonii]|uniref:Multi antimicrobial extrusion protein n=1 Tax=Parasponia andersonii TaxID=3476 RepID=A0A2P5CT48_PARAD|nr:Multi antimicrobial extrusion protein [Parasponia andersonii]
MGDNSNRYPLLSSREEQQHQEEEAHHQIGHGRRPITSPSFTSSFVSDADDIAPINDARRFFKEFSIEAKKLWYIAGPAIFTVVAQYSLGAITQVFSGHLGTLELAAVSIQNFVISGFTFGILLGMGSALETLCGQAFGAGQLDMLGIYMQRSWIVLIATGVILSLFYIFAEPILLLIGQTPEISRATGVFCLWMVPEIFAYALNFPIAKFLQAQSKIMAMAAISAVALVLHTFFSWLLVLKLEWGLVGAAVVMNASWWFIVVAQLVYIFSGTCDEAWSGFSWKAFHNLWGFVRLSFASAVMLCLELWYFMILIVFAGYLKNAKVSVDALSIW